MLEIALALFAVLVVSYAIYFRRPKNYPPGPWRVPILGNLLSIGNAPHLTFAKWKDIYGPVIAADFGSFPGVAVNNYKLIRELLNNPAAQGKADLQPLLDRGGGTKRGRDSGKKLMTAPYQAGNLTVIRSALLRLLFTEGSQWSEQRRFTVQHLKNFGFAKKSTSSQAVSTETIIYNEVQEWLQEFQKDVGKPVSFKHRFHAAMHNIVWTLVTGERMSQDDPDLKKLMTACYENMENNNGVAAVGMFIPWFTKMFPKLSGYEAMMADLPPVLKFLEKYVDQHRATNIPGDPRDLIDAYLDKIRTTEDPNSSFFGTVGDKNLTIVMLDLFFAATETTSNNLNWLFLYLTLHPEVEEKLFEEIDQIIGTVRLPTLQDRENMPYTQAVLLETIRKASILPLLLFHKSLETLTIQNYTIPKGTMILPNIYEAHHDPQYWGDPEKFRPERFLAEDGKTVVKHEAFFGFGAGKRACFGEKLAMDELFIYTTSIFQNFRIRADPENPQPLSTEPIVSFSLMVQNHKLILDRRF